MVEEELQDLEGELEKELEKSQQKVVSKAGTKSTAASSKQTVRSSVQTVRNSLPKEDHITNNGNKAEEDIDDKVEVDDDEADKKDKNESIDKVEDIEIENKDKVEVAETQPAIEEEEGKMKMKMKCLIETEDEDILNENPRHLEFRNIGLSNVNWCVEHFDTVGNLKDYVKCEKCGKNHSTMEDMLLVCAEEGCNTCVHTSCGSIHVGNCKDAWYCGVC